MALTVDSTGNPITVSGTTATAGVVYSGSIYVKFIRWFQPTTAGHLLSVTDSKGNDVTDAYCDAANETQDIPVFTRLDGIKIDDMDSGSVFIYHENR